MPVDSISVILNATWGNEKVQNQRNMKVEGHGQHIIHYPYSMHMNEDLE